MTRDVNRSGFTCLQCIASLIAVRCVNWIPSSHLSLGPVKYKLITITAKQRNIYRLDTLYYMTIHINWQSVCMPSKNACLLIVTHSTQNTQKKIMRTIFLHEEIFLSGFFVVHRTQLLFWLHTWKNHAEKWFLPILGWVSHNQLCGWG